MSKSLLTSFIQKGADITKSEAQDSADAVPRAIIAGLKASGVFVVPGLGTFTASSRKVKFTAMASLLKEMAGEKPDVQAEPTPPLAAGNAKTVTAAAPPPAKAPAAKAPTAKAPPLRRARTTAAADAHAAH